MLKLTKTGIGLLTRQYRSVLRKCWMINVGVFALATMQSNPSNAAQLCYDIDSGAVVYGDSCPSNYRIMQGIHQAWSADYEHYYDLNHEHLIIRNDDAWKGVTLTYQDITFTQGSNYSVRTKLTMDRFMLNGSAEATGIIFDNQTYTSGNAGNLATAGWVNAYYQTALSATNKLNTSYIDTSSSARFVSDTEKSTWNSKATLDEVRALDDLNNYYTKYGRTLRC